MSNSQRLEIRQSQNLVMTPQLQQAIKLLQMSNIELSTFVQQELDTNPLLEEDFESHMSDEDLNRQAVNSEYERLMQIHETLSKEAIENCFHDSGPDKGDRFEHKSERNLSDYRDFSVNNEEHIPDDRNSAYAFEDNLRDFLSKQLHMATRNPITGLIGSYIIGLVEESGYLNETAEEISGKLMVPLEYVEETLDICKSFEPSGIFAANLQECLTIQLADKGVLDDKMLELLDRLELLAKKEFSALMKQIDASKDELQNMIMHIKALNPKPGSYFQHNPVQPLIPDILVEQKHDGGWKIELNSETLPKIAINTKYQLHLGKDGTETDKFIRDNYSRASWLMRSLDQRADTILRVASEILRQQDGFFAYGFTHLKPMNLKLVAEELELHESTISRVTSGKYLRCPKGIFELKFFFMSGIASEDGSEVFSSESIKYEIKKLIDLEKPTKILSDEDIASLLKKKDIDIARRTVAKYREALSIPSSVMRRREKKSLM
ncbi:MAG: RNA polymerase factor sigma-54 [Pseudomonadota bacterium]